MSAAVGNEAAAAPAGYPPQPWALRGQLHVSTFLVPPADVPAGPPPGFRTVRIGRFAIVGAAWVSYEPGGVLTYSEVMATVLVRRGWRVMPSITSIWVDSASSRDGGRALWAIPKELAEFDAVGGRWSAVAEAGPIATGTVRPRLRLPGRFPVSFSVAQSRDGGALVSPVHTRAGVSLCSATWQADPSGPLSFLAGRSPIASFTLTDFRMSFGRGARPGGDAPVVGGQ